MKNLFSIEGKTALVTGGSRGIGLMIARGFVEAGASVFVSSRKVSVCEEVAAELSQIGPCTALPADLSEPEEVTRLAAEVAARVDHLDILVNNAGATWGAPLDEFPMQAWDKILDVNLKAVFALTQALLPQLRAAARTDDPARVINIGSIDGIRAPGGQAWDIAETYSYSASKAAVHHLTAVLAKRLGREGITVNAIAPGPFESKMMNSTLAAFGDEIAGASPLGRIGRPEDMAGTAIFLSSLAGSYLTGTVIPVDGGLVTTR